MVCIVETSTKPHSATSDYECFIYYFYMITKPIAADHGAVQFETDVNPISDKTAF